MGDIYCGEEVLDSFVGEIVDLETEGWFRKDLWRMGRVCSVARRVAMIFLLYLFFGWVVIREIFLVVIADVIVVYSANDCFFCS